MKLSKKYYDLFLKTGDPMCLLLSRDFEKTEKLKKRVVLEKTDDLSV